MIDLRRPVSDWGQNRGLAAWWLAIPPFAGGRVWYDLTRRFPATKEIGTTNWRGSLGRTRISANGSHWFDDATQYNCSDARCLAQFTGYPITLSAWYRPTVTVSDALQSFIAVGSAQNVHLSVGWSGTAARVRLVGQNTSFQGLYQNGTSNLDQWQHVVAVFAAANDRRLYLDGQPNATHGSNVTALGSISELKLGGRVATTGFPFENGYLDDLRWWNRILSDNDVAAIYRDSLEGYRRSLRRRDDPTIFLLAGGALPGTLADGGLAGDTLTGSGTFLGDLADGGLAGDTLAGTGTFLGDLADGGLAGDTLSGTGTFLGDLADGGLAGDTLAGTGTFLGDLADGGLAGDTLAGTGTLVGVLADGGLAGDLITSEVVGPGAYTGTLADGGLAGDTLIGAGTFLGALADGGLAGDTLTGTGALLGDLADGGLAGDAITSAVGVTGTLADGGLAGDVFTSVVGVSTAATGVAFIVSLTTPQIAPQLTIYHGDDYAVSLSGFGDIREIDAPLEILIKPCAGCDDDESILWIAGTELKKLNGADAAGTVSVDWVGSKVSGVIAIWIEDTVTEQIAPGVYSIEYVGLKNGQRTRLATGSVKILRDVTR